ncbi:hypothetical protein [Flavobacterium muglaense]|uniref:Uncharacterized protein n=1 Tax=Flavobacterium muglaense TaxID=2764716 RepID=A0A923N5U9_9FLAO|nr:hypothetical protein [Flavobacterium muglaense]MBC5839620.1 hypothetical protein [Flavobacterium muglaense]MBC5846158.1 hypothetical protein [Flavobacterium muglaense]
MKYATSCSCQTLGNILKNRNAVRNNNLKRIHNMKKIIQLKDNQNLDVTIFTEHISLIRNIEDGHGYAEGKTIIYMTDKLFFIYTHLTYNEVLELING